MKRQTESNRQVQKKLFQWIPFVFAVLTCAKAMAFQEMFSDQTVVVPQEAASVDSHLRQIQQEKNGLQALQKQLILAQGVSYLTPMIAVGYGVSTFVHEIERRVHKNGLQGILSVQKVNPKDERFQKIIAEYEKDISAKVKGRNISAVASAASGLTFWAVDKKWIPYIQQQIDLRIHRLENLEKDLAEDFNVRQQLDSE